jgi:hypothetical protein
VTQYQKDVLQQLDGPCLYYLGPCGTHADIAMRSSRHITIPGEHATKVAQRLLDELPLDMLEEYGLPVLLTSLPTVSTWIDVLQWTYEAVAANPRRADVLLARPDLDPFMSAPDGWVAYQQAYTPSLSGNYNIHESISKSKTPGPSSFKARCRVYPCKGQLGKARREWADAAKVSGDHMRVNHVFDLAQRRAAQLERAVECMGDLRDPCDHAAACAQLKMTTPKCESQMTAFLFDDAGKDKGDLALALRAEYDGDSKRRTSIFRGLSSVAKKSGEERWSVRCLQCGEARGLQRAAGLQLGTYASEYVAAAVYGRHRQFKHADVGFRCQAGSAATEAKKRSYAEYAVEQVKESEEDMQVRHRAAAAQHIA